MADQSISGRNTLREHPCTIASSSSMSATENTSNNNAEQSIDIMDVTTVFDEGEDSVILTEQAIDNGEKKQLQCNKDLWPMITYLHSRLQAVIADNQALHAEVKILKAFKLSTDGKIGDVQDECRSTKHKMCADIQSIKFSRSNSINQVHRLLQCKLINRKLHRTMQLQLLC